MKVELMYDGKSNLEIVKLDVPAQEFKKMIEFDYQERLASAADGEVIRKRTPQEILDEINRKEYNSWQKHNRRKVSLQQIDEDDFEMNALDLVSDFSQVETHRKQEEYEAVCKKIHELLKPEQAEMIIVICLDGVSVNDYAVRINDRPNNVSKRYNRLKRILREKW